MRKKLIKSEIAKLFNITKAAIRHYEDKKIISSDEDINGYKLYDWEEVEKLDKIIFLKNLGVSIKDIKKYINNEESAAELLKDKKNYIDEEIDRLMNMKSRIDNILELDNTKKVLLNTAKVIDIEDRQFFMLKGADSPNIKMFYESVEKVCSKVNTINEIFILLHENYDQGINSFEYSKMLLPYKEGIYDERLEAIVLPKGRYLVIDYIYRDMNDFKIAYEKAIDYANKQGLNIDKSRFIEIEYKDYSILHKEKLYELQFKILN